MFKSRKLILQEVYAELKKGRKLSKGDLYELCDLYEPTDIIKQLTSLSNKIKLTKINDKIYLYKVK